MVESKKDISLESILVDIGELGKYQIILCALVGFAVILHSGAHVAYVFTALHVNHRCEVPPCDSNAVPQFEPSWLPYAVPYKDSTPAKCQKYAYNMSDTENNTCSYDNFERSWVVPCDSFVYKTDEISILQEYNLQCDDNMWKLTLVGTINSVGQFFGLFIGGIISDKYGRKVVLIWGMVICAVCGILRTFMPTYELFLLFEFLDAAFGSGTYICGFVLGVELVGPKRRVLTGILSSSCYAVGEVLTACAAWLVKSWKPLIYILYSPIFLLISYIWIVPESVRWNLSKGRIEEAKKTLRLAAKVNGKELPEETLDKLEGVEVDEKSENNDSFLKVLTKSTTLTLRLINCCFCWITCTFLFYGLTLNSVSLAAGNSYLDFILTSLIEIPAYICCNFMLDLFGRRWSVSMSFFTTGAACIAFIFVPPEYHTASLSVYLLGKFGATAAFTNVYVITSEMFPTTMRHSFMGTCSTFGRLGSMIAPQTPLLAKIWEPLPLVSFAAMAVLSGLSTLLFPETTNIKLPDTVDEAENLSKAPKVQAAT